MVAGSIDQEMVERNVLHRFKQYKKRDGDTGATRKRGAFSEAEVRAILNTAHGMERPIDRPTRTRGTTPRGSARVARV